MRSSLIVLLPLSGLLVGGVLSPLSGCVTHTTSCTLQLCGGGFSWRGRHSDATRLEAGAYELYVTLEGDAYRMVCNVPDDDNWDVCDEPELLEGSDVWRFTGTEGPGDADPASLRFTVADWSGGNVRVPREVTVRVELEGATLFEESYEPEYERDDYFWGEPACGFCEFGDSVLAEW